MPRNPPSVPTVNRPARSRRRAARDPNGTEIDIPAIVDRAGAATRVAIDVGAGDGRYVYRLARAEPGALVIAVDPAPGTMRVTAARAARSAAHGGAPNAIFCVSTLEDLDTRLDGLAHVVTVTLPWAGLLQAVLRPEPAVLDRLRRLMRPGAILSMLLNADRATLARCGLPDVVSADTLAPAYAAAGLGELTIAPAASTRLTGTVWEGRLARRSHRPLVAVEARALPLTAGGAGVADARDVRHTTGRAARPGYRQPEEWE